MFMPLLDLSYLNIVEEASWLYALPYSWFAGLVQLALGNADSHYLFLSAIAVFATILLVIIPLWRIALKYSERISYMGESPVSLKKTKQLRSSILARLFRDSETLAAFDLVSKFLKRDRSTKIRIYAILGMPIAYIILMFRGLWEHRGMSFDPGIAVMFSLSPFFLYVFFISSVLSLIKFSEHWKAAWLIAAAPLQQPGNFFKGAKIAILVYLIIPYFAILITIYSLIFGVPLSVIYILPSFIGSLCYLSFYSALNMYFPFSLQPQEGKWKVNMFALICSFFIFVIVIGMQYPAYLVHKALYIALYSVTIVSGIIIFKIQEGRSNRRFGQVAMNNLQYESQL